MVNLAFTDSSIQPDETLLFSVIGKNQIYWKELMRYLHDSFPDVITDWKYYKDANGWLLPVTFKKKNLCWISAMEDTFRVSFWFGPKVTTLFENSNLPDSLKEEFRKAKQNKMGRGISVYVTSTDTLENVKKLLEFKNTLK
jgi:hypothetical protein